jgi:pimeloyl-ACP methyl ester carboxylesterase
MISSGSPTVGSRPLWRTVRRLWAAVGLLALLIFAGWSLIAYRASSVAHAAARSTDRVDVHHEDGIWSFLPRSPREPAVTLIFFPGGLVSPVAYAPLMQAVASQGFPAFLVELPRRGAFGGADSEELDERSDRVLSQLTGRGVWMVGGHSRGAVVASRMASLRRAGFAGLVLIGTTHPRDVDLSSLAQPVTKIVATRDGLASPDKVASNRAKLPAATKWVWIEGGNHSQFGWYGFQPGDRRATISAALQRETMIASVVEAMVAAASQVAERDEDSNRRN